MNERVMAEPPSTGLWVGTADTLRPVLPPLSRSPAALDEAFGALPMRFIRAARKLAAQSDCAVEWGAVESAYDAIVSARE